MKNIDKSKLVLIENKNIRIEETLKTKEIGFYHDAWNRFKKNKVSLIAFIIISILMFFVLFGPYFKEYDLVNTNNQDAYKLVNLPPKIPGLERLGIFDGKKSITRGKNFLYRLYNDELGEGIIISGFSNEMVTDPQNPYYNVPNITVVVDMYKYTNYIFSIQNELGNLQPILLTQAEFDRELAKNSILEVVSTTRSKEENGVPGELMYMVRVDHFKKALSQLPEDTYFWFGTNAKGEDLFTVLWVGSRVSILLAIVVVLVNALIGITLGAISGYYGGTFDLLFDRFVDVLGSIPFLAVLTILTARYGSPLWVIVLCFTATGWIGGYGSSRIQFYRFKNREYVLAAKTLGASDARVMFKHIFPNAMGIMVTSLVLAIPSFIIGEATYSFLQIIRYDGVTSVGSLLDAGQQTMEQYPHLLLFPALYISIMMIAFNLFGNGLRDALNPSLRGVE